MSFPLLPGFTAPLEALPEPLPEADARGMVLTGAIGCFAEGAFVFPLPDGAVYPGSYPVDGPLETEPLPEDEPEPEEVLDELSSEPVVGPDVPVEGVPVEPVPSLPVEGSSGLMNCDCCIAFIAACEIEIAPLLFDGAVYPGS